MSITQQEADIAIERFKNEMIEKFKGYESISMAMIISRDIVADISIYELDIAPHIRSMGLTAPSASELFGVELTISESK